MNYGLEHTGTFNIEAKVQPESTVSEVEAALWNEIEKVRRTPLASEELEKAKNAAEMRLVRSLASLGSRADRLQMAWCYKKDTGYIFREAEIYRSITAEEVRECAARYLDPEHSVVAHVVPKV
jgi:predicted Zn-dependent peptidase